MRARQAESGGIGRAISKSGPVRCCVRYVACNAMPCWPSVGLRECGWLALSHPFASLASALPFAVAKVPKSCPIPNNHDETTQFGEATMVHLEDDAAALATANPGW